MGPGCEGSSGCEIDESAHLRDSVCSADVFFYAKGKCFNCLTKTAESYLAEKNSGMEHHL